MHISASYYSPIMYIRNQDYCIFHFLNQSSLKVKPMLIRKVFEFIKSLAELLTH